MTTIPVILLTGFLGAGKTTLLGRALADPALSGTAVIVNELGRIGIDDALIKSRSGGAGGLVAIELTTGCLCCSGAGDVRATLLDLVRRRDYFEISPFVRIIIETTGLADPAPLLHHLQLDRDLSRRFRPGGVVTVLDAVRGETMLDRHEESRRQLAMADRIIVSKTDLVLDPASERDLEELIARAKTLNPLAEWVAAGDIAPVLTNPPGASWLERLPLETAALTPIEERHDGRINAISLTLPEAMAEAVLIERVKRLAAAYGSNLIRLKGLFATGESPEQPLLIEFVGDILSPPERLAAWPTPERGSRLVVIGTGVARAKINELLGLPARVPQSM